MKHVNRIRVMLIIATTVILGCTRISLQSSHAFQPTTFPRTRQSRDVSLVLGVGADDNEAPPGTEASDNRNTNTGKAVGRGGGRRRRLHVPSILPNRGNGIFPALVLFSLLLVLVPLFGGGGNDVSSPSVYYYQSTSFESTILSADGSVQTTKKTSVETNMPSLLEGKRLLEDKKVIDKGYARPSIEHDDF